MSEITKAEFETQRGNLEQLLNWTMAPLDTDKYEQAYLNLSSDVLRTIANAGQSIVSFCEYRKPYIQDVELHESVEDGGMEAILNVPDLREYMRFVGGDRITIQFHGQEDARLAQKMTISGDLTVEVYLPSSESDIESKALQVVERYDERDRWVKSDGDNLSTSFVTDAEELEKIVRVTEFDDMAIDNYPVTVEDGELLLDANDKNDRNSVSGTLNADDVQGPDVSNTYSRGVDLLFSEINGSVEVETEQDSLLNVIYGESEEFTCRYAIYPSV